MSKETINIDSIVDTEVTSNRDGSDEKIIELYNKGTLIQDIVESQGLTGPYTIYDTLRRNDIPLRGHKSRSTVVKNKPATKKKKQREKQVVKDYIEGKTLNEISKNNGITTPTIYRVLKDHGVKLRVDYKYDKNKPTQPLFTEKKPTEKKNTNYSKFDDEKAIIDITNSQIIKRDNTIKTLNVALVASVGLNIITYLAIIIYAIVGL